MENVEVIMSRVQSNVPELDGVINLSITRADEARPIVSVDLTPEEFTNMMTTRQAKGSAKICR